MTIYHNPQCKKSRETLALMDEKGIEYVIKEYLKTPLSKNELTEIVKLLGIKPVELVRKNELVYKEHYKGRVLSDEEWLHAMAKHPKLIERPIVISEKKAIIGRPPKKVLELL